MVIVTIEDAAGWRIDSYGNGWAYQIERKRAELCDDYVAVEAL